MNKTCIKCKEIKDEGLFRKQNGKNLNWCKKCANEYCRRHRCKNYTPEQERERQRIYRANNIDWAIYNDSRRQDKLNGLENNLTRDIVAELIKKPCSYCGGTLLRMTLDRIDNRIGHLVTNVVPCCIRCNYIRRSMPYHIWLKLVPAVKAMYENGDFEGWVGAPRNTATTAFVGTRIKDESSSNGRKSAR